MDFEKIEQAYTYLLENVQVIQSDLATNFLWRFGGAKQHLSGWWDWARAGQREQSSS